MFRPAPRYVATSALCAALAMTCGGGCATALVPGDPVARYSRGGSSTQREAPRDGEYSLHDAFGDLTPHHVISIRRGDLVGFRKDRSGEVTAFAGEHEWTMSEANYVWMRKE